MTLAKSLLLTAIVWLVTAMGSAQASFVCPGTCLYADSVISSTDIYALDYNGAPDISDVTGAPVYDPLEGIVLSVDAGAVPTESSTLIVHMPAPVSNSLWIVSDNDETASGFVADERFQLLVSNDGNTWEDLGTFYNDNPTIDVTSYGTVNFVQLIGIQGDIDCGLFGPPGCIAYTDAMEVIAIAGIGEAAVVPVPAAVWLFGSGLIGLISVARRR
jgi:hypothetical protein